MKNFDTKARKNFPWVLLLSFCVAIALVLVFNDPLTYIQRIFAQENLLASSLLYVFVLSISVFVSRFTIAPAVPFVAKILTPELTFILTVIGWGIGASGAFLLGRYGGDSFVRKFYPLERVRANKYRLAKEPNILTLVQTRLFAALDNLSYYIGLKTKTSYATFITASIAGGLPSAFIFSFSADAIVDGNKILLFSLFFAAALIGFAYISFRGLHVFERPAIIYSRRGSFSASEVLAIASLMLFFENRNKQYVIKRVKDFESLDKQVKKLEKLKKKKEMYVIYPTSTYDEVGNIFGTYDGSAGVRGNAVPYTVFGLVWKKYGSSIAGSDIVAKEIEQRLVWGVDAEQSGIEKLPEEGLHIETWTLSEVLEKNVLEGDHVKISRDKDFELLEDGVSFAKEFLERLIQKVARENEDKQDGVERGDAI